jgi:hypothetical protein
MLLRNFGAAASASFSPSSGQAFRLAEPKLEERRLVELSGIEDLGTYPLEITEIQG